LYTIKVRAKMKRASTLYKKRKKN